MDNVEEFKELLSEEPKKFFTFDIETYIDTEMPEEFANYICEKGRRQDLVDPIKIEKAIKEQREKFALSPLTGMIIHVGIKTEKDNFDFSIWNLGFESDVLKKFWQKFNDLILGGYRAVSKGGKRFDLPFLMFRSLKYDVDPQFGYIKYPDLINKYKVAIHCDLENLFEGSLAKISYRLVDGGDYENHGNETGEWYKNSNYQKILDKNWDDLMMTYLIYKKLRTWL